MRNEWKSTVMKQRNTWGGHSVFKMKRINT